MKKPLSLPVSTATFHSIFFFLSFFCLWQTSVWAQTWDPQTSGTTGALYGVHFTSANDGFVVGEAGQILATANGGTLWTPQSSGTTQSLTTVTFVSSSQGWCTGEGGTILTTSDGGLHWDPQTSGTIVRLNGIAFTSATKGWAVGNGGVIRATTDGGTTWTEQTSSTSADLYRVEFVSDMEGWIVGTNGIILHTTDGGAIWSKQLTGLSLTHYDLSFTSPTQGWVSAGGTVLTTTDGGNSWAPQPTAPTGANAGIQFISPLRGWLTTTNGVNASGIYVTEDGGVTWSVQATMPGTLLTSVFFQSPNKGWAIDAGGKIFAYTCIDPGAPNVSSDLTSLCGPNQSTNLKILGGDLNSATDWFWYSGSCGGTSLGNGTNMVVSPSETTTYYARGEGGCVIPGLCESITIVVNPVPDAPIATPPGGTYPENQLVTLTSGSGFPVFYTKDGTEPDTTSEGTLLFTDPLEVSDNFIIKSIAVGGAGCPSQVRTDEYVIAAPTETVATPALDNPGGTYVGSVTVTITCSTPGASIFYTTNGNKPRFDVPNSFTKAYTGPIEVYGTTTIRAIAIKSGFFNSGIVVGNYLVTNSSVVDAPSFSPPAGNYPGPIVVAISSPTPDAVIFMTTNGITPSNTTPAAKQYSGPFNLSRSITLKAIAYKPGFKSSAVSVGIYTIGPGRRIVEDGADFYYENDAYVEEIAKDVRFTVFPNPTSGKFHFQSEGFSGRIELNVRNMVGQVLKTSQLNEDQGNTEIDLSDLPSGLYHVSVSSNQIRKEFKITKL